MRCIAPHLTLLLGACASEHPAPPASGPWMRPAEQGASSAIYFTLRNPGTDTLVLSGVEVDVAGSAMLHRSMDHEGMASMMHVDSIIVPPHDSAVLAERGLHVMANDLRAALVVGDTVSVRLLLHTRGAGATPVAGAPAEGTQATPPHAHGAHTDGAPAAAARVVPVRVDTLRVVVRE